LFALEEGKLPAFYAQVEALAELDKKAREQRATQLLVSDSAR